MQSFSDGFFARKPRLHFEQNLFMPDYPFFFFSTSWSSWRFMMNSMTVPETCVPIEMAQKTAKAATRKQFSMDWLRGKIWRQEETDMPQLLEISGIDTSQGLPVPDGTGSLGNPGLFSPPKEESIYTSLLLTASSVITIAFLIRALPKEPPGFWQVVGYAALSGAAVGGLRGLAGIIASAKTE